MADAKQSTITRTVVAAPPAPETAPLTADTAADIVVIGGGYTGLSAALHLAEGGAHVALLEAPEIGFGGSGQNVGLVNAGMWLMPDALPDTLDAPFGERLLEQLGRGPQTVFELIEKHDIECEVERAGTLHCAVGRIEARAEQWQKRGAPVLVLNAEATRSKVGGGDYTGALLDKRAGTIQPLACVRGLARAALAMGARIFTQSEAVTAQHNGLRWRISTESGSVEADLGSRRNGCLWQRTLV